MRISGRLCVVILLVISLQMVVGCGSGTSTGITPPPPSTYTIGGTVSGLVGAGLVLQNNSGDNQSVSANGAFTFSTSIDSGAAYSVTVSTEPTGQNCTVTNGSGKASANVTNIQVVCSPIYEWTWMGGSNLIVGISGPVGEPGNYGTLETASAANIPGGSAGASSWTGGSGNFWLFGGMGWDDIGHWGFRNALWEFNPSTNEWTWMGGADNVGQIAVSGVYGTKQTPASGNIPGGRDDFSSWTDSKGNFWLFGGSGIDANGIAGCLNDLWKFNPSANQWAWMGGSSTVVSNGYNTGVYGTLETPDAGNIPGSRYNAASWTDSNGNLWLFGGNGIDANSNVGLLNDLWEFNPSTNQWAWMGGSSTMSILPDTLYGKPGVYGTLGTPAAGNIPGSRNNAASWTDSNGHLWLFGGNGYDANSNQGWLNDLWEFNPSTNQWAWMGGSSVLSGSGQNGVYGMLGTPAAGNIPGGRLGAVSWTDSSGHLWLFGGNGYDANGDSSYLNDLWEYNPTTNQWAWISGNSTTPTSCHNQGFCGQFGVYGTLGTPAAANMPGGRTQAVVWTDSSGDVWLFGGSGFAESGSNFGWLNDFWEYQP